VEIFGQVQRHGVTAPERPRKVVMTSKCARASALSKTLPGAADQLDAAMSPVWKVSLSWWKRTGSTRTAMRPRARRRAGVDSHTSTT
jgi:hypothetical protein